MKILLVTEFFPTGPDLRFSGGVEARTFFIAKYLARTSSNKVTVIASRTRGTPKTEKMFNFTVHRVGEIREYIASVGHLISRIKFFIEAVKFGQNLDVEIIDAGNYISHVIGKRIAKINKKPVVAWYPDVWLSDWIKNAGVYGLFGELLERFNLLQGFDSYIAISRETADKLRRFKKENINVIYCGVEKKEFIKSPQKFRNPTIICVSRLAKYKNIKTLIFAFAHLTSQIKTVRLLIVGSGPEEQKLRDLAKQLNIAGRVKFLSNLPRKELIALYQSSHIFSLPSVVEGFGIATIEAAAAGLPFVNSNIPIQKEITKNGQGGFLVGPDDLLIFSKRFYQLITDQNLYANKSKEAKNLAKNYDWAQISKETEKIYRSLL